MSKIKKIMKSIYKIKSIVDQRNIYHEWHTKSSMRSLIPYIHEEVSELHQAIRKNDIGNITEELGDIIYDVIFMCILYESDTQYNIQNVFDMCIEKMEKRLEKEKNHYE